MWRPSPIARRQWKRFRSLRRAWVSFLLFGVVIVLSLGAELWINKRALVVHYDGGWYFPVINGVLTGEDFGLGYPFEVDYRELDRRFEEAGGNDWVLLPPVPYGPLEIIYRDDAFPPYPPSIAHQNYLGTDALGRDVLARLVYGFRIALGFALALMAITYALAILIGCAMGFFGGRFDLFGQRVIEIWSNIPFLYVVIILSSVIPPGVDLPLRITALLAAMGIFSWVGMASYTRTGAFRERSRDYVSAALVAGAGPLRVIRRHMLPNIFSILVTFIPFALAGGMTALTSLDFLGFGVPPPTPSWGELLEQGTERLDAPWIVTSTFFFMAAVLILVTFIGEGVRDAFDPKKHATYR